MSDPKYQRKYLKTQVILRCSSTLAQNETEGRPS
jgi:hypothetical protein